MSKILHKLWPNANPLESIEIEQLAQRYFILANGMCCEDRKMCYEIFKLAYNEISLVSTFKTLNTWEQIYIREQVFKPHSKHPFETIPDNHTNGSNNLNQVKIILLRGKKQISKQYVHYNPISVKSENICLETSLKFYMIKCKQ